MSLADLLTFIFYSEEGAIAEQCNTPYTMIQDTYIRTTYKWSYYMELKCLATRVWPPGSSWGQQYIIVIGVRKLELLFTSMKGQQWMSVYRSNFSILVQFIACSIISLPRSALNKAIIHLHFCIMLWWHFKVPTFCSTCTIRTPWFWTYNIWNDYTFTTV